MLKSLQDGRLARFIRANKNGLLALDFEPARVDDAPVVLNPRLRKLHRLLDFLAGWNTLADRAIGSGARNYA